MVNEYIGGFLGSFCCELLIFHECCILKLQAFLLKLKVMVRIIFQHFKKKDGRMAQGLGGTVKNFSFLGFWFCHQQAGSKNNSV